MGHRQNFPRASPGKPYSSPLGVGPGAPSQCQAGPSWRLSALLIPSPLAKGRERSSGPAMLSGSEGMLLQMLSGK